MTTGFGFCPNCGMPRVAAEQRFCAGCGLTLSPASPPAPQTPSPIAASVSESSDLASPIPPPAASEPFAAAEAPADLQASGVETVVQPLEAPADLPASGVETVVQPVEAPPAPPPWAAQPVAPPAWSMPPAAAPTAPPSWTMPPPAPGAPIAQAVAPAYPGTPAPAPAPAPTPRAPGTPIATVAGIKVTPKLLAIGGIVLAVIIAVVYMATSSKAGGITFAPSTLSCSSSAQVTTAIRLPSSILATEKLNWQIDGVTRITSTVADNFKQQTDGTWLFTDTSAGSSSCTGPSGPLSMGTHSIRILDVSGRVLAEGSFTLTP